ncbi:MAG: hypothetical protein JWO92_2518 [Chitinophagaceae bacterium]|nr:hypothetical protein [Chitinophagaceae bacterium]
MKVKGSQKKIGYIWFYEKSNPGTGEKYISVEQYDKIYKDDGRKTNACKQVVIYDEKEKVVLYFDSKNEAAKATGLGKTTIYEATNNKKEVIIKNRFRFKKLSTKPSSEWEYSNKNYASN